MLGFEPVAPSSGLRADAHSALDVLEDKRAFLVVAELQGKIAGAVLYRIREAEEDPILRERSFGYIEELAVREVFRDKGIGKQLLEHSIQDLEAKGLTDIELHVWESNPIGIGFYEKHGFRTVQRRMKMRTDSDSK